MRALGVIVLLCTLLAGCGNGEKTASVESYRADPAGTTLTLDVVARPGATARAETVSEDDSTVVVKVRVTEPGGDNLDLGQHYMVTVELDNPLGRRAVRTDSGEPVPAATS